MSHEFPLARQAQFRRVRKSRLLVTASSIGFNNAL